jgi:hypothetical protein
LFELVTTADVLNWFVTPALVAYSPTTAVAVTVTNLGSTGSVVTTFTTTILES